MYDTIYTAQGSDLTGLFLIWLHYINSEFIFTYLATVQKMQKYWTKYEALFRVFKVMKIRHSCIFVFFFFFVNRTGFLFLFVYEWFWGEGGGSVALVVFLFFFWGGGLFVFSFFYAPPPPFRRRKGILLCTYISVGWYRFTLCNW